MVVTVPLHVEILKSVTKIESVDQTIAAEMTVRCVIHGKLDE